MKLDAARSALVVVDIQVKLARAIDLSDTVVERVCLLMEAAKTLGIPIIATEQAPNAIGPSLPSIADRLTMPALSKTHFDATSEQEIAHALADLERDTLIFTGMEAHVCVLQTALGAIGLGYNSVLCADAVGSRTPENKAFALDRLSRAGGTVVTSEMVVFEWLGHSDRPEFKPLLEWIK